LYNEGERLVFYMKEIYKKGIVSYSYKLNGKWVGDFDCDVEDFKKYFESRKSFEEMMLINEKGVWYWNKKKWLYLGK